MTAKTTVMFADLTGSTGLFEAFGNEAATRLVTGLTQWISQVCVEHGGRVVKTLGDGVLAVFPAAPAGVDAVVRLQREHARRQGQRGPAHQMELQVGLDSGDIVEVEGDCYGDAVNVAARLSDLSGPRQILVSDTVADQLAPLPRGVRLHPLGRVPIRGKAQERVLFRVEWDEGVPTDMMTLPAWGARAPARTGRVAATASIELRWLDQAHAFRADELPVHLGRAREAEFVVADPHVSRLHARIEWRADRFVLVDLSSNGTSVRFDGATASVTLRREDCVLHTGGEIVLGPDAGDWLVPTIAFSVLLPAA